MYIYVCVYVYVYVYINLYAMCVDASSYGVATISRLLKIIGLFCRI